MHPSALHVALGLAVTAAVAAGVLRVDGPSPAAGPAAPPGAVVAVVGPLTGRAAAYGTSQRDGALLAAEDLAALDLPPALRMRLVFVDDEADQTKAGALARDLVVRDRVAAFVGAINSDCTHQLEMVCVKLHVPQLTTASTDPSITDTGSPWIFRCLADDVLQAKALAAHLFAPEAGRGPRRVALLSQNNRYGRMGIVEVARAAEAAGAPVVLREQFESGTTDFEAVAGRVAAARPDGIVVWGFYREGAALVRALRAAGVTAQVLAGDGLVSPEFLRLAGKAAEGTVVTYPFDPDGSERARIFARRFEARFGHAPDSFAAHAYDAVTCVAAAAARAGSWEREAVRAELAKTRKHPAVTGDLAFDATGNDVRPVHLARVVRGRFVPLGEGP